jgi:predicted nucleic acid-binding protein
MEVLARVDLVRINDRILVAAGALLPAEIRSLDAIHLATAQQLGAEVARIVTYDQRMAAAAHGNGWLVVAPS